MGEFGFSEMIVIGIIAIIVYGKDLPAAARKLAKIYSKFRRQLTDIKDEIQRQIPPEELNVDLASDTSPSRDDPVATEPPRTPTGLRATPGHGQIELAWDAAERATGYNVRRAWGSDFPSTIAYGLSSPSYVDSGLTDDTPYTYTVCAVNAAGESSDSEQVTATTLSPAPAAPDGNGSSQESAKAAEAAPGAGAASGPEDTPVAP